MIATQLRILGVAPCGLLPGEIAVDLFAGGGGWSEGFRAGAGVPPAVAVNHDPHAVRMHADNHPDTEHFCESVHDLDPHRACRGRAVGWLHLSPDCTHFSRAKGGKPRSSSIRGLAWVGVTWAAAVAPRIISLENVSEFQSWGPLLEDGSPDRARAGETFAEFVAQLRALGYVVEWRVLCAADFGAPTIRRRLFLIARRDGLPIRWPQPTHGDGRAQPWRPAAECIDWSDFGSSIFERKRPLAPATCRRIAAGIVRYVLCGSPFIVTCNHGKPGFRGQGLDRPMCTITGSRDAHGIVSPTLIQTGYGERPGQAPRVPGLHKPMGTVVDGSKHALVSAFLAKHYTGVVGSDLRAPLGTATAQDHHSLVAAHMVKLYGSARSGAPMDAPAPTITGQGGHAALCAAFLVQWYSQGKVASAAGDPLPAVVARARHGLVIVPVNGVDYVLADIRLRMLKPRELARAQGFGDSYQLTGTQAQQIARVGNSVCPPVAEAVVRANLGAR